MDDISPNAMPEALPSMYAQGGETDIDGDNDSFQGDGSVKGPGTATSDSIPAKLSNGEFVFAEPAVQFFGVDKLNKMNEQGKQGYMQALGQVQQNQQNSPQQGAPPSQMPAPQMAQQSAPPPPQQGMAKGGGVSNKRAGYCGM